MISPIMCGYPAHLFNHALFVEEIFQEPYAFLPIMALVGGAGMRRKSNTGYQEIESQYQKRLQIIEVAPFKGATFGMWLIFTGNHNGQYEDQQRR